jgi:hypothetical protein
VVQAVAKSSELIGMPALIHIQLLDNNKNKIVSFILSPLNQGLFFGLAKLWQKSHKRP